MHSFKTKLKIFKIKNNSAKSTEITKKKTKKYPRQIFWEIIKFCP